MTIEAPASVAPGDTIPDVAAGPFRVVVHFADGDSVVGEVAVP